MHSSYQPYTTAKETSHDVMKMVDEPDHRGKYDCKLVAVVYRTCRVTVEEYRLLT
jgi:hypothetical protein